MPAMGFWLIVGCACSKNSELIVFHAPSLSRAIKEVGDAYVQANPNTRMRVDISGSQVAARKLTELNQLADVVVLSDAELIDQMLLPDYAEWGLRFATNELVIAHAAHSRYTDEITTNNWPEVLTRKDVRIGMANPDTSPLGYRTLFTLQLAEPIYERPNLQRTIRASIAAENVVADEAELWALLSSRAVDYAFLYKSTAEDHRLKLTALPEAINLGRPERSANYSKATTDVLLKHGQSPKTVNGSTIWYGLTIPRAAPHPEAAQRFVSLLLSETGQKALRRAGFRPIVPAFSSQRPALPADIKAMTTGSLAR